MTDYHDTTPRSPARLLAPFSLVYTQPMRHVPTLILMLVILGCGDDDGAPVSHDASVLDASLLDASDRCPSDLQQAVGQVCAPENRSCGTCTDPCQFCNLVRCQNGHWEQLEVFPMPCNDSSVTDAGLANACVASGGTVSEGLCCGSASDFPNTCNVGACGCAPQSSKQVATCVCPATTCWNGTQCE